MTTQINVEKEKFKYGVKGGKVRDKSGKSMRWAKRVEEKKKELNSEGLWTIKNIRSGSFFNQTKNCDFCGHRIHNVFSVESSDSGHTMEIGCECVKYFTSLQSQIEILIKEIRKRAAYVDNIVRCNKIHEIVEENKDYYKGKIIDYRRYSSSAEYNFYDLITNYIKRKAGKLTLENLFKTYLSKKVNIKWYNFTNKEKDFWTQCKQIKGLSKSGEIIWEVADIDLPRYTIIKE